MIYKALGLAALSILAVGCIDGDTGDTTDTNDTDDWYTGPWQIAEIDVDCASNTWTYEVTTDGYAGSLEVFVANTGDSGAFPATIWVEDSHIMDVNVDWDEEFGAWDMWSMALTGGATVANQTMASPANPNTGTTLPGCDQNDDGSYAWMITMKDDDGATQDCVYFGYKSYNYFGDHLNNDCLCFEGAGNDADCTD